MDSDWAKNLAERKKSELEVKRLQQEKDLNDRKLLDTNADKIWVEVRRAAALLGIATAQAKAGDRKGALALAETIHITPAPFPGKAQAEGFDFRVPPDWCKDYEFTGAFTIKGCACIKAEIRASRNGSVPEVQRQRFGVATTAGGIESQHGIR